MKPAKAVGGDFYDYFLIDDNKLGLPSATFPARAFRLRLFMSVSRTVLRTVAFEGGEPGTSPVQGQRHPVRATIPRACSSRSSTPCWICTRARSRSRAPGMTMLCCSPAPMDASRCTTWGRPSACSKRRNTRRQRAHLAPADTLLLLTDGITEAFNIDGRVFSSDRVVRSVTQQSLRERHGARSIAR